MSNTFFEKKRKKRLSDADLIKVTIKQTLSLYYDEKKENLLLKKDIYQKLKRLADRLAFFIQTKLCKQERLSSYLKQRCHCLFQLECACRFLHGELKPLSER
ncbi:hypothetical protein BSR23_003500 [Vibrio parahaemolyticus]|nr:hypothetical protein BSR23_003500 [Vibrio parahaemolyticus]